MNCWFVRGYVEQVFPSYGLSALAVIMEPWKFVMLPLLISTASVSSWASLVIPCPTVTQRSFGRLRSLTRPMTYVLR